MIILGLAAYIWRNRVAGLVSTNIDFSYKRSSVTRLKNCKEIVFLGVRGGGSDLVFLGAIAKLRRIRTREILA